jgi:hypothetical protein
MQSKKARRKMQPMSLRRKKIMKKCALLTALLLAISVVAAAQMDKPEDKTKRKSPPASAECKFADGKTIKIDYSSPRAKGRKIFGHKDANALVPYGEVWRTGANEATTFVVDTDVTVGDKAVPAGSYTIFTLPREDSWMLIVSKKTGEWGTDYPGDKEDQARAKMAVSKTSAPVENFTIAFDPAGKKCTLHMEWENTRASVDINEK